MVTVRALTLGILAAALTACAGTAPVERDWVRTIVDRADAGGATVSRLVEAPTAVPVRGQDERGGQERSGGAAKGEADVPDDLWTRFQGDEAWERRSVSGELAVIESHLAGKERFYDEGYRRKRWGVTGVAQLLFPSKDEATDGLSREADWDDLLEDGRGFGLELSYQVCPMFEPLIGVKYNVYNNATERIRSGAATIEQKHDTFRSLPIYAGVRINFPLAMPVEHWTSSNRAGLAYGVSPFIKLCVGTVYSMGTELTLTDLATGVSNRFDFIDRGFSGYAEAAVGVEYRTKSGFAFRASIGVERYAGLDLSGPAMTAFPGVDIEDLDQGILPRLSASIYF